MAKTKIDKNNFECIAKSLGYEVEPEFRFAPPRQFRADWKITKKGFSVLIEYEGIKGKSRHTSIKGYTKDCEKYNLACLTGHLVLRYTVLNFDDVFNDLDILFY